MVKATKPAARVATTKRTYRSASRSAPESQGILVELGQHIRALRLAAGMTQEKTAQAAGVTFKHYQTIEGGRTNATVTTLAAIARALGVGVAQLFG